MLRVNVRRTAALAAALLLLGGLAAWRLPRRAPRAEAATMRDPAIADPARPWGRLGALSIRRGESVLYVGVVWVRRALNSPKRWIPARAVR
jgi:hypothetical protein